eukprot:1129106-Amorphochlora_amoeboformis.AAC.1
MYAAGDKKATVKNLRACFVGYHPDMLTSLFQSLPPSLSPAVVGKDTALQECIRRLLWTATPESVCRVVDLKERLQDIKS